tara:strand:+ start:80 stop:229 length:150 start_codon:yes stop_codon:yes gene_type:complete
MEKNAMKHTIGIMNHIIGLFFLRAMHIKKIEANEKIKECRYANGVPDTG